MHNHIVAGVDGSSHASLALEWAAEEAECLGASLVIVHVAHRDQDHDETYAVLEAASRLARKRATKATITTLSVLGNPAQALAAHAREARLLVVGGRGLGAFRGFVLGSVSRQLVSRAPCPLAVVRQQRNQGAAGVAVGMSGRYPRADDPVLAFAFREAEIHGGLLRAVHAWAGVADEEERLLAEALAGWRAKHPTVTVEQHYVYERAGKALMDASRDASVVVIGSRRGALAVPVGRAAQAVLYGAQCPIVVVGHQ